MTELKKVLETWSKRSRKNMTLDSLLARWAMFVGQVEHGYPFCIADYANDLSVRDILEDVLSSVAASGAAKIREAIAPWDERFSEATREIDRPLLPAGAQQTWWFRVPLIVVGELRGDLEASGLA